MSSAADSKTLPDTKITWPPAVGDSVFVAEHQYLEDSYTFGPSGKCKVTLEFTGVKVPMDKGKAGDDSQDPGGASWLQIYDPGDPHSYFMNISSGFFDFNPGAGQPTSSIQLLTDSMISIPISNANWSSYDKVYDEVILLEVTLDRTTNQPNVAIDMASANINFVENSGHQGTTPTPGHTPATFRFRAGSRLLHFTDNRYGNEWGGNGARNFTITKFECNPVA